MRVIIDITPACIRQGKQGKAFACAVALAGKKAWPGVHEVCVTKGRVSFYRENGTVVAEAPMTKRLVDFIRAFDDNKSKVKPGRYYLETT